MKFLFTFIFVFNIYKYERILSTEIQQNNDSNNNDNSNEEKLCSNPLIQDIGLQGLKQPSQNQMSMCWNNEYSCCSSNDQNIIVEKWKEESKELLQRFEYYEKIYFELLQQYEQVSDRSLLVMKTIMQNIELQNKETECKILSRRILHLKINEIKNNIQQQIQKMHNFFEISYKGFYCSLCDPATSLMYEKKEQIAILSQKYCRDIVINSLNPLLYLNIHLPQLTELMNVFITRCNKEGIYNKEIELEQKYNIQANKTNLEILQNCKNNHNGKNWFSSCKLLCDQFDVVTYKEFFSPYLQFFEDYTLYIKQQIEKFDNPIKKEEEKKEIENKQVEENKQEKKNRKLKKQKIKKKNMYWRILEQEDTGIDNNKQEDEILTQEQQQQLLYKKLKEDRQILKLNNKQEIHLVSNYDKYGIDLYDYGTETEIILQDIKEEQIVEQEKVVEQQVQQEEKKVIQPTVAKGISVQTENNTKITYILMMLYFIPVFFTNQFQIDLSTEK